MKNSTAGTWLAIAFTLSTSTAVYSCEPHSVQSAIPIQQQVNEVTSHLVGVMDTSAQAKTRPNAPNVRITTCKVKVENAEAANSQSIFLYQEQAMGDRLNQPYRQRFLRIAKSADSQSVESAGFKPSAPQAWIGFCDRPEAQRVVQLSDIGKTECSVFLRREGENYVGETQAGGCPANYRGAVKITNRIVLRPEGMDTFDRGLDANGNVVWGARQQPYQFRWVNSSTSVRNQ